MVSYSSRRAAEQRTAEASQRDKDAALEMRSSSGREHLPAEAIAITTALDRSMSYLLSRFTFGLAPLALAGAYHDWIAHLAASPGKQLRLGMQAWQQWARLAQYAWRCASSRDQAHPCVEPAPNDRRFSSPSWQCWPFGVIHQGFLLQEQWWEEATTGIRGVTKQHERQVTFAARQILDIFSPANFVATNPDVLYRTQTEYGRNLLRGAFNLAEDLQRLAAEQPPVGTEVFKVGERLAITPGRVIYRNRLMELIQYTPTTAQERPEPVLITPAWIMKYYILDLQPENSLVRFLVGQGFTVFVISWKNPQRQDRDLGLEDYRQLGIEAALAAIGSLYPGQKIHGVGYCLGGTLLAMAAAARARIRDDTFATLSFFAAQVDFEDAGELTLFISEAQVAFLEDMMWHQGYLDAHQMAGAFQILRSNDLIWSRIIHDYLIGERRPVFDLMAWNADATRLPARMHSEYLRQLFLDNDLAEGKLRVEGRPIALTDIRAPVFAVGTLTDHVAPWRSVYKFHLLLDTSVTFLLTSGGHNTGIVSAPGSVGRSYQIRTKLEADGYLDPETWQRTTEVRIGSWWPEWCRWLHERSGEWIERPGPGVSQMDPELFIPAPGLYVLQH